jgi:type I restriction enzyme M protein
VLHLNTLDYDRWHETADAADWQAAYGKGYRRLRELQSDSSSNKIFQFDLLMANPPFAGDIIHKYELGFKRGGDPQDKLGRDILFIERNLEFLKSGGRMAIVLPQGRFNNTSDKYIRDFIAEHCRILAVVGLHQNTFKPHTGTKTSVLFVQKWTEAELDERLTYRAELETDFKSAVEQSGILEENKKWEKKLEAAYCDNSTLYRILYKLATEIFERADTAKQAYWEQTKRNIFERFKREYVEPLFNQRFDYPIFFAVSEKGGKDNSGEYIYVTDAYGERKLDKSGHFIVDHDLHNHGGELPDGIAEAFIKFAKEQGFSFWR